jgi:hypothetical protein
VRALKPLSETLNRAVLALAAKHWPAGWMPTSGDTQATVERLMADGVSPEAYAAGRDGLQANPFPVYAGASDRTIFGDPKVNHAFRAWHDAWHLRLRAPFTPEGERAVCRAQMDELHAWTDEHSGSFSGLQAALLYAEIIGQLEHQTAHGAFPENQRAFVRAYVKNPARALARRW